MRRTLIALVLLIGVVLPGSAASGATHTKHTRFGARLDAAQEVATPPVASKASGRATFRITDRGTKIRFWIAARGLDRITMAHIHIGARGTNGPVSLFLFPMAARPVSGEGWSVSGTLTAADLIPTPNSTPPVTTFAEAVAAIRAGKAYANIHTVKYGAGEIRGQILPAR